MIWKFRFYLLFVNLTCLTENYNAPVPTIRMILVNVLTLDITTFNNYNYGTVLHANTTAGQFEL